MNQKQNVSLSFAKNPLLLFALLFFSFHFSTAQQTEIFLDPDASYKKGLELFDAQLYSEAQNYFSEILEREWDKGIVDHSSVLLSNSEYYHAVCALELEKKDAEKLLLNYLDNNDESLYTRLAWFHLARYYYKEKEYANAIRYFEKVRPLDLSNDRIGEYKFKLAYCYFYKKKFDKAKPLLKEVKQVKNQNYYPANYYYGFVSFFDKDYTNALESFEIAGESELYNEVTPYYITQCYFLKKQFDEVIKYATPQLDDKEVKYHNEMNHLIGQSYFEKGDYKNALPYLENYVDHADDPTKEDIYQLAFAFYKQENYSKAIENFRELNFQNDSIAQSALYLMGDCYLKTNEKTNARNAFQEASKLKFDLYLKEISTFNYAKLSFELGFSKIATTTLKDFINDYPKSVYLEEGKELLTEIYISTNNYSEALEIIQSIENPGRKIQEAYQLVSYYQGVDLFNEQNFDGSIKMFNTSLKNPLVTDVQALCHFWTGEIYFRQGNYSSAISNYNKFIDLYAKGKTDAGKATFANAYYGLAYSYLKQDSYSSALTYFNKSAVELNLTESKVYGVLIDCYLREADCSFLLKDYDNALTQYQKAIDLNKAGIDYAIYQKGILYNLKGNPDSAIESFNSLYDRFPKSIYADAGLYELGNTYFKLDKYADAINTYSFIISDFPDKQFARKAYLQLALVYGNMKDCAKAENNARMVLNNYPESNEAKEAFSLLVSLSGACDDPGMVDGLNLSSRMLDSLAFASAEKKFISGDCNKTIQGMTDYLGCYPAGIYKSNAHYYRAECLYSQKDYKSALTDYEIVIGGGQNEYSEKSYFNSAEIYYFISKDNQKANAYYKKVYATSGYKERIRIALLGLIRTSYDLKNYGETETYATSMLNLEPANIEEKSEAHYYLGKVSFQFSTLDNAKMHFENVLKLTKNRFGAESKYYIALIQYMMSDFENSTKTCFELINQMPSQEYWVIKSFILIADNYYSQNDLFQAKATLNAILETYPDHELAKEAQIKLDEIIEVENNNSKIKKKENNDGGEDQDFEDK